MKGQLSRLTESNSSWPQVRLDQVCSLITDGTHQTPTYSEDGVVFLSAKNVTSGKIDWQSAKRIPEWLHKDLHKRLSPQRGDLLLAKNGTTGVSAIVDQDIVFDIYVSLALLRPNANVTAEYLNLVINSPSIKRQFNESLKGIGVPNLHLKDIRKTLIPLPPLPEQRRIADILDRADALRAKRRAAISKLETMGESIFLEMFGDPLTNPKNWDLVRCDSICDRITVGIVVKPSSYYVDQGVPALRSLNIKPGRISLNDLVYFSESDNDSKLSKSKLFEDDVVLVRTGQPGTAAIVPKSLQGANAIDILITTPQKGTVDPVFFCRFFNSSGGRDLVLSEQRGQVQKHLNVGSLCDAKIPLPPFALQQKFAARMAAFEQYRESHFQSLAKLDDLFASLQHRAFRGEL